ncbi:MAG: PqqD family protein [Nitriliruptorales bacterium]|nr:PqqD family protein [Nitriliruptorales bacterium]
MATVEIDREGVLFDPETRGLHVLNATALAVWESLDGASTVGQIASRLAATHGADPAVVRAGVLDVLRDFAARGLLEVTDDATPSGGGTA